LNSFVPGRLFSASCTALIVTALAFAIRGATMSDMSVLFGLNGTQLGWIAGAAFWGTAISLVMCGPLCDLVGLRLLLFAACFAHLGGIVLTIFSTGFWSLFFSTVLIGLANGLVEGAANPMIATLYKTEKTKRLNLFHAWWPGGIIIGGLITYVLRRLGFGWQIQVVTMLLPTVVYGLMFVGQKFPQTERVASGVSNREMFAECLRPLFFFMMGCMFLTAATENGTNQWIAMLLEHSGVPGILVLVWITGLMMIGRLAIGTVVQKLGITGILLTASIFTAVGLYWMSRAVGLWSLAAAAVYALGICYYWPTMLGFVSERLPRSGALGLAVVGGAGMISISVAMPIVGHIYDQQLASLLPSGTTLDALRSAAPNTPEAAKWAIVQLAAGSATLHHLAILPCILVLAFTILILQQRGKATVTLMDAQPLGEEI
jgi:MFS family permease